MRQLLWVGSSSVIGCKKVVLLPSNAFLPIQSCPCNSTDGMEKCALAATHLLCTEKVRLWPQSPRSRLEPSDETCRRSRQRFLASAFSTCQ